MAPFKLGQISQGIISLTLNTRVILAFLQTYLRNKHGNKRNTKKLKQMPNDEAAKWIIDNYSVDSNYWIAFDIIPHLSWKKSARRILSTHYFSKLLFSSSRPYALFLKIMPARELIESIKVNLDNKDRDRVELMIYNFASAINDMDSKNISNKDKESIKTFLNEFGHNSQNIN